MNQPRARLNGTSSRINSTRFKDGTPPTCCRCSRYRHVTKGWQFYGLETPVNSFEGESPWNLNEQDSVVPSGTVRFSGLGLGGIIEGAERGAAAPPDMSLLKGNRLEIKREATNYRWRTSRRLSSSLWLLLRFFNETCFMEYLLSHGTT